MTPERWQRLRAVFHQALEIPDSARAAFVSDACSGDAELGEEVASLFEAHRADSYLERPAAAELQFDSLSASSGPASADDGQVPDRIGPYTVTRLIARGGMGAVYLAVRDGDFHKQVAIKVIKRGMDSEAIVRRFRNERQILAHFDHPGIARLLDGGSTPGGQPYLVMEYIEGEAITAYSEARSLGVRARLGLFRAACEAVQYAHQNLVIHRDLKPGNILVTTSGRPKLLDFGIAKILNPDPTYEAAEQTMTVSRVLTPEYASPEQSRGGVVTTASDVYALGVLLFELLTGRRPYRLRTRSPEEVARAVCEQDVELASALVPPGSRLQRELRGDLDAVVAKALEKEPMRRYASASALSDDLGRYLEGKPVTARRATRAARAIKFMRRHRLGVAAATAVGMSLGGGLVATMWQARVAGAERQRAEVERVRAERRFGDVRKLAGSFLFEFNDAIQDLEGALPARRLVVKRGVEYLEGLWREADGDPALRLELARGYLRLGRTLGDGYWAANSGDFPGALEMYRRGLTFIDARIEWPPAFRAERAGAESDLLSYSSQVHGLLGDVLAGIEASQEAQRAHALHMKEYARLHPDVRDSPHFWQWSELALDESDLLTMAGDLAGALRAVEKMMDGQRVHGVIGPLARGTYFSRVGAIRHMLAASASSRLGDSTAERALLLASLDSQRQGYEWRKQAWDETPDSHPLRSLTGQCLLLMANAAFALGRDGDARRWLEQGLALTRTDQGQGSGPADWGYHYRGRHLIRQGRGREALEDLARARAGYERALAQQRQNVVSHTKLAAVLEDVGDARWLSGNRVAAEVEYRASLRLREDTLARASTSGAHAAELVYAASRLASRLVEAGRSKEARVETRRVMDALRRQADAPGATASRLTEYAWCLLTAHPTDLRDPSTSLAYAQRAVELPYGNHPESLAVLAVAQHLCGDTEGAVSTARRAYELVPEMRAGRDDAALRREIRINLEHHPLRPLPRPL